MAVGTQPTTLSDLRIALLSRVRDVGGTGTNANSVSINDIANSYLNTSLHDMHINPLVMPYWAMRRAVLITHAPYTTGTVSITAAARTTLTGSSTLWSTAVTGFGFNNARVGGKIKVSGLSEIYTVSAVGGDTAITLETLYPGDALTDTTYTYFEDEYALASDFLKMADARLFSTDLKIPLVGPMEFRRTFPRNDISGKPRVATLIQLAFSGSTTPRPRVVLHPYPDDEYSIPYSYITSNLAVSSAGAEQTAMTADADEPIVPLRYRHALVAHALYNWYMHRKDDTRSQEAKEEYTEIMGRIANDHGIGSTDRPRFVVRTSYGMRRRGARYSVDTRFDELLDR